MIRPALLPLLLAAQLAAANDDVAKGLQNLTRMHQIAAMIELRREVHMTRPLDLPQDPWGARYRVDESESGYRVIGAGGDGTFDEKSWSDETQFDGVAGDAVLADGRMMRSNRNWLYAQAGGRGADLDALREAETGLATMRNPRVAAFAAARATSRMMVAITDPDDAGVDAWGTPLRVERGGDHVRIISAGSDRTFDPASWDRAPAADPSEDIVVRDGKLVREVDPKQFFENNPMAVVIGAQPPDPPLPNESAYERIGNGVRAPVVTKRVEPEYPETYRRLRASGVIQLELALSKTGAIDGVRVIKSLAPEFDMSSVAAVRQWQFEPATRDGQPVPSLFHLSINFKLK